MEHTHGFKGRFYFFQRTLYFMFLEMEASLSKPAKMILGFFECGNEFSHMFSQFHLRRDTTMPTTETQEVKNSLFLYGILEHVCIHLFPE